MGVIPERFNSTSAPEPPAGVGTAMGLHAATERRRLCALGYHAWTPWFQLPMGSFVTYCARPECGHQEQYDL
jgi:hypothetical protein